MELKSPRYWAAKKYTFVRKSNCPACESPTETWRSPGGSEILLDSRSFESHFASCDSAKEYRQSLVGAAQRNAQPCAAKLEGKIAQIGKTLPLAKMLDECR